MTVEDWLARIEEFVERGDMAGRLDAIKAGLADHPDEPQFLFALAAFLRAVELHGEAVAVYETLLARMPESLAVLHNLGSALAACGRTDEARRLLRRRVQRAPEDAGGWLALAEVMVEDGWGEAEAAFRMAVSLRPDDPRTLVNYAEALIDTNRFEAAACLLRRALDLNPQDGGIAFNLANVDFARGAFQSGLQAFEGRLGPHSPNRIVRSLSMPRWDGGMLAGRHIFILAEQGIGDQLWWAPFVRQAVTEAGRATIEVAPKLVPLYRASFPDSRVIPLAAERRNGLWIASGESRTGPDGADVYCETGSIPLYRWNAVVGFPSGPVLRPSDAVIHRWSDWLARETEGPRVGICWRSHLLRGGRGREYLRLSAFAQALRGLDGSLISLQIGDIRAETASLWAEEGLHVVEVPGLDLLDDVEGVAGLIHGLDAVVTTATWIARLASALGKPTLILGNTPWMAQIDGREPAHPMARTIYPDLDRSWPEGVIAAAAAIAPDLLTGRW